MIILLIKILMVTLGTALYVKGETETKWLGKSNKNWKLIVGLPVGIGGFILLHTLLPFVAFLTYLIASIAFGYGEKNPWTKWLGEQNAIILTGAMLGLASFPVIGLWSILAMIISGATWYYVWKKNGVINEPYVAIYRSLSALILLAM